jgi:hypothetical protein
MESQASQHSSQAAGYAACTVTSPQYLAHARVMTASYLEHNPGSPMVLLYLGVTGLPPGAERNRALRLDPEVEVLELDELGEDRDEVRRMGLMYSTQGLAGATKPRIIRWTLAEHGTPTLFIDSDIRVYESLAEVAERAAPSGALLTTHSKRPLHVSEYAMLTAGVFNSGFLAIADRGLPLLDWWCERTRRDSIFDPRRGLLWEQGWLALAPAFFEVSVARDPGLNTMGRELLDRDLAWDSDQPRLGDTPLRCYHFSGPYDPTDPDHVLAPPAHLPGIVQRPGPIGPVSWLSLDRKPGMRRLSHEYATALLAAGYSDPAPPAAFSQLPDGSVPHRGLRRAYRRGVLAAEAGSNDAPPNPFLGEETPALIDWAAEAPGQREAAQGLSRFALALHEAFDGAASVFPRVPGEDVPAFLRWLRRRLACERDPIPAELVPAPTAPLSGVRRRQMRRRGRATGQR